MLLGLQQEGFRSHRFCLQILFQLAQPHSNPGMVRHSLPEVAELGANPRVAWQMVEHGCGARFCDGY